MNELCRTLETIKRAMLDCQKALFSLPEDITYLNGAYMSPQLRSVEEIGIENLKRKSQPHLIQQEDFFSDRRTLCERFATLINAADARSCVIIPSVSYGTATVAKNIPLERGDQILLVDEQFPSNVYAWQELAREHQAEVQLIQAPKGFEQRGLRWNENILHAITQKTKVVAMPHVHWADGTQFDLVKIGQLCRKVGAKLIIDGTQSVGALPFDVNQIQPDALICGGYKWLMGPYSLGLAYYGPHFDEGKPIEYNWMNRHQSENFSALTQYQDQYQPKAGRYSVGESSNFILVPMLLRALDQLLAWTPAKIQQYCGEIQQEAIPQLQALDCYIEENAYRAFHLFGVYLPEGAPIEILKDRFRESKIYLSYRGKAVRVSPGVYNTKQDLEQLVTIFKSVLA
ncbi:aminotransferase class V-fold PLP-dependent enzyme [Croceiramulus getboli]|nr:aminotransferase class V-fold PLP-dependent enzyme [Flavobacteriaceae bacterium YJPT1-3]